MKKRNSILIFFSLLILFACNSRDSNKQQLSKAEKLYEKKEYAKALLKIDSVIRQDSSKYDFIVLKSKILTDLNDRDGAIRLLLPMLKNKYKVDTLNYLLGDCYLWKGNADIDPLGYYDKAIIYYNDAISFNIFYRDAYKKLAICYGNMGRYKQSLETIERAQKLIPDDMSLIATRGFAKFKLGDYMGANADYEYVLKNKKSDSLTIANVYLQRAQSKSEKIDIKRAIEDLNNSLSYYSKNFHAYVLRGFCYKDLGMKDKACEDFKKATLLGWTEGYEIIRNNCN